MAVLAASGPSPWLVGLAVLVAILALGALASGVARLLPGEPAWLAGARHTLAEAGVRTSATLSELADWLRLGR